ncbi:MAG: F0F1 ATP synthase subunit delta [Alphaproteobacteria bacterium]
MATNASSLTGLAERYATALFELAVEGGQVDAVAADLATLGDLLGRSGDLDRLVRSPVLTRDEQGRAITAIVERAEATDLTRRFVGLLAERRRLFVLADIIAAFNRLLAAHRGEVRAEVASATGLSADQLGAIAAALKRAVGGNVAVNAEVDAGLIGGLVVRVGSRMVDASLRTKLERLHLAMKETG